jgi:hypothetical protein
VRLDGKLAVQHIDAMPVLTDDQLGLLKSRVASHQELMPSFTARVG